MDIEEGMPPLEEACSIAAAAFGVQNNDGMKVGVQRVMGNAFPCYSLSARGKNVGFAAFRFFPEWNLLYLSGIVLLPDYQGGGIAGLLVARAREATGASMLCLKTQSPFMWRVGQRLCDEWYPSPSRKTPQEVSQIAVSVLQELKGSKDEELSFPTQKSAYRHGAIHGRKPVYPEEAIQGWWDGICDFERGDAVLSIGMFARE